MVMGNITGAAGTRLESQSPSPPLEVIVQSPPPAVGSGGDPESRIWTC